MCYSSLTFFIRKMAVSLNCAVGESSVKQSNGINVLQFQIDWLKIKPIN